MYLRSPIGKNRGQLLVFSCHVCASSPYFTEELQPGRSWCVWPGDASPGGDSPAPWEEAGTLGSCTQSVLCTKNLAGESSLKLSPSLVGAGVLVFIQSRFFGAWFDWL